MRSKNTELSKKATENNSPKQEHLEVRWYLMTYSYNRKGLTLGLEREIERRKIDKEAPLEYFAPRFVEAKEVDGKLVRTNTPLLFNYFFVKSSANEIFRMKKFQPQYNFLRREFRNDGSCYFPFVEDEQIQQLRWIADSYSGILPILALDPSWLIAGDRIRVTKGPLKGLVATLFHNTHTGGNEIMVYVDKWSCVPILNVKAGQYELLSLGDKEEKQSTQIAIQKQLEQLHQALLRLYDGTLTSDDKTLASTTVIRIEATKQSTDIQRSKKFALLLMCYKILGDQEKVETMMSAIRMLLQAIKSEQSKVLLYITLYACSNNSVYYNLAHEVVDPWQSQPELKKSQLNLQRRLAEIDQRFHHTKD